MSRGKLVVGSVLIVVASLAACGLVGCTGPASNEATVTVLGSWTGDEEAGFMAIVRGFERKYDDQIQVVYHGTRDAPADLTTDLENGHPPDLAVLATPGVMKQYAAAGKLVPLDGTLDLQIMQGQYGSSWLQLMQASGRSATKHYYAVIVKAAL
jgi:alpha-glucoside transport system substrate-binding protein